MPAMQQKLIYDSTDTKLNIPPVVENICTQCDNLEKQHDRSQNWQSFDQIKILQNIEWSKLHKAALQLLANIAEASLSVDEISVVSVEYGAVLVYLCVIMQHAAGGRHTPHNK